MPKSLRTAMGLSAGSEVDIVLVDGRLEIEAAPADVDVETSGGLPVLVPTGALPSPLLDDDVRAAFDATRR